jgi:hypothetical protein
MRKKTKLVAFTLERARRIRKNSGGVHTSIVDQNTRPRVAVARVCLGRVAASFSGSPATFTVDRVLPISGNSPVEDQEDTLTVENRYDWDAGNINAHIEILYDPHSETWIPRQMTCPN